MPLTATLDNLTVEIDQFHEKDRGQNFLCPICETKMTLVFPEQRISHFRHLKSTCGLSETYEHLLMKKTIKTRLQENNTGAFSFEKRIILNGDFNIIDLELIQPNRKVAVECQASSMPDEACAERTKSLNRLGYNVLWVLSNKNFDGEGYERIIKQPESFIHAINYGRVYYLDTDSGEITPQHFTRIERSGETWEEGMSDWGNSYKYPTGDSYSYYLKKKRHIQYGPEVDNLLLLNQTSTYLKNNETFNLARFYDKKFW
jgi:hypothetical protein